MIVKDLDENVRADGHADAGVEEVASVDDDWSATAFGLQRTECGEEVFDGAVTLEKVHVFDTAEITIECGGDDDDGDMRATAAEVGGNIGTELAGSEVIVEDGDVDVVEELSGLFDGGRRNALIAVLTEDGGAEMEIGWFVVEQEDTNVGRTGT